MFFSPWSEATICLTDMHSFSFGNLSTDADQPGLSMGPRDLSRGDPSYFLTAVVTETDPTTTDPDGCVLTPGRPARSPGTCRTPAPGCSPSIPAPGSAPAVPPLQPMAPCSPTVRSRATRSTTSPTASASRTTTSASSTRSPAARRRAEPPGGAARRRLGPAALGLNAARGNERPLSPPMGNHQRNRDPECSCRQRLLRSIRQGDGQEWLKVAHPPNPS